MKMLVPAITIAAIAMSLSSAAIAQNPTYRPGSFLEGYNAARQRNEESDLRVLQQIQILQQIQQQQRQQQQQQAMQEQQRQSQIEEMQGEARKSIADQSKEACVSVFMSDPSAIEDLMRRGSTVGKFCTCVEQEMFAVLTLDLSGKILIAGNESGGDNNKFWSSSTGQELANRRLSSFKACAAQVPSK